MDWEVVELLLRHNKVFMQDHFVLDPRAKQSQSRKGFYESRSPAPGWIQTTGSPSA